jgi:hypothetical protein
MPVLDAKIANFVSREVSAAQALIDAFDAWDELRKEWDAQGLSALITDDHLTGGNAHVSAADLANAFSSIDALESVLAAGHATNLYKLIP